MDFTAAVWVTTAHTASVSSDGQYVFSGMSVNFSSGNATLGMGWAFTTDAWAYTPQGFVLPFYFSSDSWSWTTHSFLDKRQALRWSVAVTVGGIDVSARLTGVVTVDAEESTSRLASFSLKPTGTLIAAGELTGQAVNIDFVEDPDGVATTTRLFTGEINEVDYDVSTRLMTVKCFDNLQAFFRGKTEAQILASIPGGYYSEHVFGEREDGWEQAQDVLSTVCGSFDKDRNGNGVFTSWSGGSVSLSLDARYIVDGSIAVEIGREKDRVHQVDVTFQYRYARKHQRLETKSWNWGVSVCDWLGFGLPSEADWQLPTRDMFDSAVAGTGWLLSGSGIEYTGLPPDGAYLCNGDYVNFLRGSDAESFVTAATWTWTKPWVQTVTETYTVSVGSGANVYEDAAGFETAFDEASWEGAADSTERTAWPVNAAGDRFEDVTDRTALDNALLTILNKAYTTVMASHRSNRLSADTSIQPALERSDFVSIEYPGIASGHGKVVQYKHRLDLAGGVAVTSISIATNAGGGGAVSSVPAVPSTDATVTPTASPLLGTYIGNDGNAPDFDEDWTGVITNYDSGRNLPVTEAQLYPKQVRVRSPEIDTTSRDEAAGTSTETVAVPTGTDTLTIGV